MLLESVINPTNATPVDLGVWVSLPLVESGQRVLATHDVSRSQRTHLRQWYAVAVREILEWVCLHENTRTQLDCLTHVVHDFSSHGLYKTPSLLPRPENQLLRTHCGEP